MAKFGKLSEAPLIVGHGTNPSAREARGRSGPGKNRWPSHGQILRWEEGTSSSRPWKPAAFSPIKKAFLFCKGCWVMGTSPFGRNKCQPPSSAKNMLVAAAAAWKALVEEMCEVQDQLVQTQRMVEKH